MPTHEICIFNSYLSRSIIIVSYTILICMFMFTFIAFYNKTSIFFYSDGLTFLTFAILPSLFVSTRSFMKRLMYFLIVSPLESSP